MGGMNQLALMDWPQPVLVLYACCEQFHDTDPGQGPPTELTLLRAGNPSSSADLRFPHFLLVLHFLIDLPGCFLHAFGLCFRQESFGLLRQVTSQTYGCPVHEHGIERAGVDIGALLARMGFIRIVQLQPLLRRWVLAPIRQPRLASGSDQHLLFLAHLRLHGVHVVKSLRIQRADTGRAEQDRFRTVLGDQLVEQGRILVEAVRFGSEMFLQDDVVPLFLDDLAARRALVGPLIPEAFQAGTAGRDLTRLDARLVWRCRGCQRFEEAWQVIKENLTVAEEQDTQLLGLLCDLALTGSLLPGQQDTQAKDCGLDPASTIVRLHGVAP